MRKWFEMKMILLSAEWNQKRWSGSFTIAVEPLLESRIHWSISMKTVSFLAFIFRQGGGEWMVQFFLFYFKISLNFFPFFSFTYSYKNYPSRNIVNCFVSNETSSSMWTNDYSAMSTRKVETKRRNRRSWNSFRFIQIA